MDSTNKHEAIRYIKLAEASLRSGDAQTAAKFIALAQRLDPDVPVGDLGLAHTDPHRSYSDENVDIVREIKDRTDYYEILGLQRDCSVDEIRKAYRKLSLKVHPDKNNAPGSDEAFRAVCKAFKCLSDADARRKYDRSSSIRDPDSNWEGDDVRRRARRRRKTGMDRSDLHNEDPDPDEVFRSFFFGSDGNVYRARHTYHRPRAVPRERREDGEFGCGGLVHLVPFLIMFLILYLPFSEPDYALMKNYTFENPRIVEKYGVEYYVKSDFDVRFPPGSPTRANIEYSVLKDYRSLLARYCHVEMQRRQWARSYPTPHCDKLRDFGVVKNTKPHKSAYSPHTLPHTVYSLCSVPSY